MAFDPDAFLSGPAPAAAAPGGAFDPDAFLGAQPAAPPAPPGDFGGVRFASPAQPREGPGVIESSLRGVKQGATLGFGDEITGALESAFTDKTYAQSRDEARASDRAAQASHPLAFGAGEIGGGIASSFIPGLGAAGAGARLGAVALRGAAQGAVAGLGNSEADLTQGDVGGLARDAVVSGALGGATAGLAGKLLHGAPERVEKRLLGNITDGATATQRDRVVGKAGSKVGDVLEAIKGNKAIFRAGDDPHKLVPAIESAINSTGDKLDGAIAQGAPILVSDVLDKVEGVAKRIAADPGKRDLARAVATKADDVLETWGNRTHVSPQEVRVLAGDIADAAFHGSPAVAPAAGKATSREVWGELKDLLHESVLQGGGDVTELKALNKQMSTLLSMRDAAVYRATRESTPSTRLSSRLSGALDLGLAFADPTSFAAKKAYDFVGKPALHVGDRLLAQLEVAAKNGSTKAQLAQLAVSMGVGRESGELLSGWLVKKFGGAAASDEPQP